MGIDITDLVASVGIAPKLGQVSAAPRCEAGWSKPPVSDSQDLQRILKLPRRPPPTEAEEQELVTYMTALYRRERSGPCRCHAIRPIPIPNPCVKTFRVAQAWSLLEIAIVRGLLGAIGVGHGKTLLDILAPLAMPDCKVALLLVKPNLVDQFIVEYELATEHFRVPSLVVHGREWSRIVPGAPVLHVMPYSRLSRKNATTFIDRLRPDFILSDEVQRLRDPQTATTSRVMRHFEAHPNTRFAGWTGSLTDKSLNDYGHLSALALRFGSPLPLDPMVLSDWSRALDPSPFPAPAGALFALCEPGESIASGYQRRLSETNGVIITKKAAIDAHLVITQRKSPPVPHVVKDALRMIRGYVRPDGEELVEAWEVARSAREAACGFFYRWIYPRGESEAIITRWFAARKAWNKELRNKLFTREEHLDSPLLCREAAIRAHTDTTVEGLPNWHAQCWPLWEKLKDTVKPETDAVWMDPYLAQDAADWGLSKRGIIWYSYATFGAKIGEISGLPVHTGGPKAAQLIAREKGDRSIVASIKAHGTGRDGLQHLFKTQLVANPPSSATAWEQLLGRLHRIGQEADTVSAEVYRHTEEFRASVDNAMSRALYVQETLGSEQKLRTGYAME